MNTKKRSIIGLVPLINTIEAQGQDPVALLKKRGLSLDTMTGTAVFEQKLELEIISDAIDLLQDPLLGIKVGNQITFTAYGTLAMLVMTAPTLMDACRLSEKFQALSPLFSHLTLHLNKDWLELRYTLPNAPAKLKDFMADRDFIGTLVFIREFFENPSDTLLGAGTARQKPTKNEMSVYRQYIDFEPKFDQAYNWFRLPSSILHTKLKHANSLVHKANLLQAYESMRKFFPDAGDIVAQVQQVISGYDCQYPTVPDIAKMFGISERTLRRQLGELQTSYREILDEHRKNRALDMLSKKDISVSGLAESLGFAESATFLRAFKRWTGCTPKQYSKNH